MPCRVHRAPGTPPCPGTPCRDPPSPPRCARGELPFGRPDVVGLFHEHLPLAGFDAPRGGPKGAVHWAVFAAGRGRLGVKAVGRAAELDKWVLGGERRDGASGGAEPIGVEAEAWGARALLRL